LATVEKILAGPTDDEEGKAAVENAYTALGVLALKHTKDQAQITRFLSALPLTGEGESQEACDVFLDHYEAIKGTQEAQTALAKIKAAVAENKDLATDAGRAKLQNMAN
jgi:hypothetical protein